ncbi:cadherin repeat domain-containing protein [Mesonia maritima]|uniref:Cadherin domain-containing protein n=1 Tax=Mesonia maritima TaxID=1793873 RepID=A0ABU1K1A8_9FLAO|nr:cadherin repeat domain-containing protein [Mesonia maritima]MDR6299389.1 hypothetical protein [Mesonia maritima]
MKKTITLILITAFLFSCSSDDDTTNQSIEISVEDFETTINENPEANQVLGSITASTNQGELVFSLIEENPDGAFNINEDTGELSVNDASLFDFDSNPTLTAIAQVENNGTTANSNILINLINVPSECEQSQAETENLFQNLVSNDNFSFENTLDLITHDYTFKMDIDGEICSIGYQGASNFAYQIRILDSSGNILYDNNHTFSTTVQDYVSITPVSINANEKYTIQRISNNATTGSEKIGPVIESDDTSINFPFTEGGFTIVSTPYFDSNMEFPGIIMPYITFGFTEN